MRLCIHGDVARRRHCQLHQRSNDSQWPRLRPGQETRCRLREEVPHPPARPCTTASHRGVRDAHTQRPAAAHRHFPFASGIVLVSVNGRVQPLPGTQSIGQCFASASQRAVARIGCRLAAHCAETDIACETVCHIEQRGHAGYSSAALRLPWTSRWPVRAACWPRTAA